MSLKVIGAGFGRTGTLSLKQALEKLGFDKCYHMMEVMQHPEHRAMWLDAAHGKAVDWDALFAGYQATVDWPSCNTWREQLAHFPEAKVVLSLRDPDKWYDSVMETIYASSSAGRNSEDANANKASQWAFDIIWNPIFQDRMDDRQYVIEAFNRHNQAVQDELPPEKLLVFEASMGWQPLCDFLEVPVPDEDYPRVNTKEEFTGRWKKIRDEAAAGAGQSKAD